MPPAAPIERGRSFFGAGAVVLKRRPVVEIVMAVPKKKVSKSRRNMRRSHHALGPNAFHEDKETGELKRPHHVDLKTGMYKGRQVLTPKED